MNTARYVLGVMLIVGLPPAIVYWLLLHSLVGFWRRIGTWAAITSIGLVGVGVGFVIYKEKSWVLGTDFGTNWILILFGAFLYGLSVWVSVVTNRTLKLRTFSGVQELAEGAPGDELLQEGIYNVVRHPRYLSVVVGTSGFSLFVNHLGAYLTVLATIPALYLVVALEERELAGRFGNLFEEYRSRVPAFVPRFRSRPTPPA